MVEVDEDNEDCEDLGYEDLLPDLKKITSAGSHLLSLINNILDLLLTIGFTSIVELIHSIKSNHETLKFFWLSFNNKNILIWLALGLIMTSGVIASRKSFGLVKEKWNEVMEEIKLSLIK